MDRMTRVVQYSELGSPDVLKIVEVDEPHAGPGQVRVRMRTAGLNPVDSKLRRGTSRYASKVPSRVGRELAGVVDEVGEGAGFAVGDEVFGCVPEGTLADSYVGDAGLFARRPAGLDWDVAGGLALAGQTAWDAVASQSPGESDVVLVSAAAGGVGLVVSQLARRAGAIVIGTASEANHDFLKSLGVIPVTYGEGLAARVREAAPGPVTIAFDQHGPETIETALELGVARERINTIATDAAAYGVQQVGRGPTNIETLDALANLVVAGDLVVPIEARYPLAEVVAAFEHLERGHLRGKIIVTP